MRTAFTHSQWVREDDNLYGAALRNNALRHSLLHWKKLINMGDTEWSPSLRAFAPKVAL